MNKGVLIENSFILDIYIILTRLVIVYNYVLTICVFLQSFVEKNKFLIYEIKLLTKYSLLCYVKSTN